MERCTGSCEWEEAPEDLALSLSQLCVLWATVSPLGDRGARDTAAALIKIVAEKVNSNLASSASIAVKGGRTIDKMLSHHAEACALYLLKISSPIQAIKRSVSSSAEQESSFIAALLVCSLKQESQSRSGWGQQSTTVTIEAPPLDNCEARKLLWKILCTCCVALSDQHVRTALTRVCVTDHSKNRSALLELLRGASESWHGGGESCDTTLLILSWCISVASSSAAASIVQNAPGSVKRGDCLSGREIVLSGLKCLSPHSRSSLELAAELLASRLSAAERTAVRHLFTVPT
jgi:hypothetical protein